MSVRSAIIDYKIYGRAALYCLQTRLQTAPCMSLRLATAGAALILCLVVGGQFLFHESPSNHQLELAWNYNPFAKLEQSIQNYRETWIESTGTGYDFDYCSSELVNQIISTNKQCTTQKW